MPIAPRIVLAIMLLWSSATAAAPPDPILFLGIRGRATLADLLGQTVLRRMARIGEQVVDASRLTAADRTCDDPACLGPLADTYEANWILGGEVRESAPQRYRIALWLFEAGTNRILEEQADCEGGDRDTMVEMTSSATGRLLEQRRLTSRPPPAKRRPGAMQPVKASPAPATTTRKILAGVFGATALVALGGGIFATAYDLRGRCLSGYTKMPDMQCPASPWFAASGYGLAAALGTGFVLSIVLP